MSDIQWWADHDSYGSNRGGVGRNIRAKPPMIKIALS
jgi:hypothetical protein